MSLTERKCYGKVEYCMLLYESRKRKTEAIHKTIKQLEDDGQVRKDLLHSTKIMESYNYKFVEIQTV